MLSKKDIQTLASLAQIDATVLENAIKADSEQSLTITEGLTAFTPDALTTRDTNNINIGKTQGKSEAERQGKELAVKVIKTKLGITDDSKDPDVIAGIIQSNIQGDKGLKDQVKLLQNDLTAKATEISTLQGKLTEKSEEVDLINLLPDKKTPILTTKEHLSLIRSNLKFTAEGVEYNGEILRDPNSKSALDKKAAINHFYQQRKLIVEESEGGEDGSGQGGRGGRNSGAGSGGGKKKTIADVRTAWEKANPDKVWGCDEAQLHLMQEIKANPEIELRDTYEVK